MTFKIREQLKVLTILIKELRLTSSSLRKKEILLSHTENNNDLRIALLKWSLLTKPFNIRSKRIGEGIRDKNKETQKEEPQEPSSIIDLLIPLENGLLRGNSAILFLKSIYNTLDNELSETLSLLIDKNLLCGLSQNGIRALLQNEGKNSFMDLPLLPPVLLGVSMDINNDTTIREGSFFVSQKLDGIRALTTFDDIDKKVMILTRSHKRMHFTIEDFFSDDLRGLKNSFPNKEAFQLDGEICLIDKKTGIEDFRSTLSLISTTTSLHLSFPDDKELVYYIFDIIIPGKTFLERQEILLSIPNNTWTKRLKLLKQEKIDDFSNYKKFINSSWEGLILRKSSSIHTLLKESRSNDFIKIKSFKEKEFIVSECKYSRMMINDHFEDDLLSSVRIDLSPTSSSEVWVGSGFSIEERRKYAKHSNNSLVGSMITVRYFEEFENSLRFPTIKAIYFKDKRLV